MRTFCQARRKDGTPCQLEQHSERVHASYIDGWLQTWLSNDVAWQNVGLNTEDPLRDAPEALKKDGV